MGPVKVAGGGEGGWGNGVVEGPAVKSPGCSGMFAYRSLKP